MVQDPVGKHSSKIRLRYAGVIVFAADIISMGTGILFILMINRNVSPEEFGIWGNILDLLTYFTIPAFIVPFWAARFFARGNTESAKTGTVTNLMISLVVFPVYLVLVNAYALQVSAANLLLYTLASFQILESYLLIALEAMLQIKKPQVIGYGSVVLEVTKVISGIALVPQFKLLGAIIVMLIGSLIQLLFYLRLIVDEFKAKIKWGHTKEWLKASFFNIFNLIGQKVPTFNLIILFVFGGQLARGFYGAALTIAAAISYSGGLGFALYPRLLSEKRADDALTSLRMILMFAIPMTTGAIVLSELFLAILNPEFVGAKMVLIVLSLVFLVKSISGFLETVIYGTERLDEKAKISIRALLRSRIFLLATFPYISSVITLPTLFYILTSAPRQPAEAALYLTLIDFVAGIALLIIRYMLAIKCLPFIFPKKAVAKYCLAAAAMIPALLIIPQITGFSGKVTISLIDSLAYFAIITLVGTAVYFAVLYLIDKETRAIARFFIEKVHGSL
jgi:O-antigen/teichoic acid export membrane protein